jgi:hypothetical protein
MVDHDTGSLNGCIEKANLNRSILRLSFLLEK